MSPKVGETNKGENEEKQTKQGLPETQVASILTSSDVTARELRLKEQKRNRQSQESFNRIVSQDRCFKHVHSDLNAQPFPRRTHADMLPLPLPQNPANHSSSKLAPESLAEPPSLKPDTNRSWPVRPCAGGGGGTPAQHNPQS